MIICGGHIPLFNGCHSLVEIFSGIEVKLLALAIIQDRQEKEKEDGVSDTGYVCRIFLF